MSIITKNYYLSLVAEAKELGVAEQPYVLACLLSGASGSDVNIEKILNAVSGIGQYTDIGARFTNLKATPQNIGSGLTAGLAGLNGLNFYNPNAVPVFLKFFDANDVDVIVGTTLPVYNVMVPALGQVVLDSTSVYFKSGTGYISVAAVTGYLDNNSTPPTTGLLGTAKILDFYS